LHVVATSAQATGYAGDALVLRDTHGGAKDVTLSDGRTKTVQIATPPTPIAVGSWQLVVDEISPTGNSKHTLQLPELKDWRDIPELKDAVGSGTYTASVDVPASLLNVDTDLMLDVGNVAGAMRLTVNGALVTRQTTPGGMWSVSNLLKAGRNEIVVRVDTLLINRVVQQSGGDKSMTYPSGLLGPVRVIPVGLGRCDANMP
jgi:hypothetical protein